MPAGRRTFMNVYDIPNTENIHSAINDKPFVINHTQKSVVLLFLKFKQGPVAHRFSGGLETKKKTRLFFAEIIIY